MAKRIKIEPRTMSVCDAASEAISELTGLGEEMREIYDNSPESLQQTDINQRRDETASTCEGFSEPDYPKELEDIKVTITDLPAKQHSRNTRSGQAVYMLQECVDTLQETFDELEKKENPTKEEESKKNAIESLKDDLENIMSEAEGLDFPGMFG